MTTQIFNQIMLGMLMVSSTCVVVVIVLALAWLRQRETGYWLRLMLLGVGAYNATFVLLLFLNIVGIRQTQFGQIFFILYAATHVLKAASIFAFALYLLGMLDEPKPKAKSK